jgi:hypothetical protein
MALTEPPWLAQLVQAGFAIAPVPDLGCLGLLGVRIVDGYAETVHIWSNDAAAATRVPDDLLGNLFSQLPSDTQLLGTAATVVAALCPAPDRPRATSRSTKDTAQMPHTGSLPDSTGY